MNAVRTWRRHPRVIPHPERPVGCKLLTPLMCGLGQLTDISVGGIEVLVPDDVDAGLVDRELIVELSLPNGLSLTLPGRVRHVEARRLGVCFVGIEPWQQRMLHRYLEQERASDSLRTRLRRFLSYLIDDSDAPESTRNAADPVRRGREASGSRR